MKLKKKIKCIKIGWKPMEVLKLKQIWNIGIKLSRKFN